MSGSLRHHPREVINTPTLSADNTAFTVPPQGRCEIIRNSRRRLRCNGKLGCRFCQHPHSSFQHLPSAARTFLLLSRLTQYESLRSSKAFAADSIRVTAQGVHRRVISSNAVKLALVVTFKFLYVNLYEISRTNYY